MWGLSGGPVTVVVAASAVLVLARIVSLPRFYDFSLIVVMVLLAWGEVLGVYDSLAFYDNIVHFTVPLLVTGMLYLLLVRLGVLPELSDLKQVHQKFGFFLTVLMMGMAIGAGWEIIEWTLDRADRVQPRRQHDGYRNGPDLGHDGCNGKRDHPGPLESRRSLAETPARGCARQQAVRSFLTLRPHEAAR